MSDQPCMIRSLDGHVVYHSGYRAEPEPTPKGMTKIDRPRPPAGYYHYSNERSQGSLIAETLGFPDWYDPEKQEYHSAYSDRLASWDKDRFNEACDIAGGGPAVWGCRGVKDLTKFAKVWFDLKEEPEHVRVIFYFNVASGYECPVVIALSDKEESSC